MQNKGYGRENVIIFGLNENVKEAIRRFEEFPELGYQIKDTIIKQDNSNGKVNNNFYVQLQEIIKEKKVDHIFLTDSHFARTDISEILNIAVKNNTKVKILSNESDEILACSRIHDVTGISLYVPKRYRIEAVNKVLKRSFDIIASSILIIAISPLFFVISLLILVESRGKGSIIFRQKRALAKGAKEFYFYKFRSMIVNADELKEQLANLNESNGALFKIKDDPRITKVGKFIRKWSLDELPQLFNVLKGDMSLVGPRPLPISDFEKLNFDNNVQRFYTKRAEAKPGITGLWQISGRSKLGFEDMILLDLYYIENQSILFDIELLFETVPAVLFGRGAY
jgi:exopolysaccharide biosynthesis polyprenyl glycosylphosphotransferase